MPYLPYSEEGYALHVPSRTVHRRYAADHGRDLVRTTMLGVRNHLAGAEPVLCPECFQPPPKVEKPKARKAKSKPTPPPEIEAIPVEEGEVVTIEGDGSGETLPPIEELAQDWVGLGS